MVRKDNLRSQEIVSPIEISSIWSTVSFINEKQPNKKNLRFLSHAGKSDFI